MKNHTVRHVIARCLMAIGILLLLLLAGGAPHFETFDAIIKSSLGA
ncbi:MAG: hypothetical protein MI924_16635 [Chloroflexales bacterium]|nr:hypothetical protein [Chloroflexales bacterium]